MIQGDGAGVMSRRKALWALAAIFTLGLIVRVVVVAQAPSVLRGDEVYYDNTARSIAAGKGYIRSDGRPTSFRTPLISLFIAGVYRLVGDSPATVKYLQAVIGSAVILLLYLLGALWSGRELGLLCAGLGAIHVSFVGVAIRLHSETLYTVLLLGFIVGYVRLWDRPTMRLALVTGVLLALATLAKPSPQALPAVILLGFLFERRRPERRLRRDLAAWAVLTASFVMVIMPWSVRNYRVHGRLVLLTTETGYVLNHSYYPKDGKIYGVTDITPMKLAADQIVEETAANAYLTRAIVRDILDHPVDKIIKLLPLKLAFYLSPFDWEVFGGNGTYNFTYVFLLPFGLVGIIISAQAWPRSLPLFAVLGYMVCLTLVLYGSSRLRLPIEPLLVLFAGLGLQRLWAVRRRASLWRGAVAGFFVMNALLFWRTAETKAYARSLFEGLGVW